MEEQTTQPQAENNDQATGKEAQPSPVFKVNTPMGEMSIDMKAYADAKAAAFELAPKKQRSNLFDQKMFTFLEAPKTQRDSRYWGGHLGALMKMHLDVYLEPEYEVTEEFAIEDGILRPCMYDTIPLQGKERRRIMILGTRFYQSTVSPEHRFIVISSVDGDGDHRLTIHIPTGRSMNTERYNFDSFLDSLEEDFYQNGPLKGAFFDLKYNFIERDANIDDLLAWAPAVKQT